MAATPTPSPTGLTRRTLLAVSAAGLATLVAGCTSSSDEGEKVTTEQVDGLADQVSVQEALVAAYAAAERADPSLAATLTDLAAQAGEQLERLRAASPGRSAGAGTGAPAVGPDPRAWLREQVSAAASSHAAACIDQTGARAALLGSIAAGLRGQEGLLT